MERVTSRHIAIVPLDVDFLARMLRENTTVGDTDIVRCVRGVPYDAIYRGVRASFEFRNRVELVFEHPSFAPVPLGEKPTEIVPEFRREERAH